MLGTGKVEFLQNDKVVSTMDVDVKAGMNRFQWNMRGPAPPAPAGRGRGGNNPAAAQGGEGRGRGPVGVPFVVAGGGGGGGGGGGRGGVVQGPMLAAGTYVVRLTVGGQTILSSVDLLDDIWMRPQ